MYNNAYSVPHGISRWFGRSSYTASGRFDAAQAYQRAIAAANRFAGKVDGVVEVVEGKGAYVRYDSFEYYGGHR
jgi:hypothetical protein